jgi:kynurenine formamidase
MGPELHPGAGRGSFPKPMNTYSSGSPGRGVQIPGAGDYRDEVDIELLGRRVRILELSREVSTTMPVYPGHVGVAFWEHLTHEQVRRHRLPADSPFRGYAVRGFVGSEHVSTHVDAVWHFNPDRPDLTIDRLPWEHLITPGAWIDVSDVPPRAHITLDRVQRALEAEQVELRPGMTLLYYTGVGELWDEPFAFLSDFPGLDKEASEWLLDQGLVNVATDAVSTDTLADLGYPNHRTHAERLVVHTENVANINRIPRHLGFDVGFFPLRLVGGTGSPCRAIALWEPDEE